MKKLVLATAFTLLAADASAVECVNRFVARSDRPNQVVTLLTGKLTFQEAQALAKKIDAGESPRFEWVTDQGRTVAKQVGPLKVVRPMPVGCDGKTSGVVVIASFLSVNPPLKKMHVKIDAETTVEFVQQAE
jgi:hypothetical protein